MPEYEFTEQGFKPKPRSWIRGDVPEGWTPPLLTGSPVSTERRGDTLYSFTEEGFKPKPAEAIAPSPSPAAALQGAVAPSEELERGNEAAFDRGILESVFPGISGVFQDKAGAGDGEIFYEWGSRFAKQIVDQEKATSGSDKVSESVYGALSALSPMGPLTGEALAPAMALVEAVTGVSAPFKTARDKTLTMRKAAKVKDLYAKVQEEKLTAGEAFSELKGDWWGDVFKALLEIAPAPLVGKALPRVAKPLGKQLTKLGDTKGAKKTSEVFDRAVKFLQKNLENKKLGPNPTRRPLQSLAWQPTVTGGGSLRSTPLAWQPTVTGRGTTPPQASPIPPAPAPAPAPVPPAAAPAPPSAMDPRLARLGPMQERLDAVGQSLRDRIASEQAAVSGAGRELSRNVPNRILAPVDSSFMRRLKENFRISGMRKTVKPLIEQLGPEAVNKILKFAKDSFSKNPGGIIGKDLSAKKILMDAGVPENVAKSNPARKLDKLLAEVEIYRLSEGGISAQKIAEFLNEVGFGAIRSQAKIGGVQEVAGVFARKTGARLKWDAEKVKAHPAFLKDDKKVIQALLEEDATPPPPPPAALSPDLDDSIINVVDGEIGLFSPSTLIDRAHNAGRGTKRARHESRSPHFSIEGWGNKARRPYNEDRLDPENPSTFVYRDAEDAYGAAGEYGSQVNEWLKEFRERGDWDSYIEMAGERLNLAKEVARNLSIGTDPKSKIQVPSKQTLDLLSRTIPELRLRDRTADSPRRMPGFTHIKANGKKATNPQPSDIYKDVVARSAPPKKPAPKTMGLFGSAASPKDALRRKIDPPTPPATGGTGAPKGNLFESGGRSGAYDPEGEMTPRSAMDQYLRDQEYVESRRPKETVEEKVARKTEEAKGRRAGPSMPIKESRALFEEERKTLGVVDAMIRFRNRNPELNRTSAKDPSKFPDLAKMKENLANDVQRGKITSVDALRTKLDKLLQRLNQAVGDYHAQKHGPTWYLNAERARDASASPVTKMEAKKFFKRYKPSKRWDKRKKAQVKERAMDTPSMWPPGEGPTGGPLGLPSRRAMLFKPELAGEFEGAGGSLRKRISKKDKKLDESDFDDWDDPDPIDPAILSRIPKPSKPPLVKVKKAKEAFNPLSVLLGGAKIKRLKKGEYLIDGKLRLAAEIEKNGDVFVSDMFLAEKHRKKGTASRVIDLFLKAADDEGITVRGWADSLGDATGLSQKNLVEWYKSKGFVVDTARSKQGSLKPMMVREPKIDFAEFKKWFNSLDPDTKQLMAKTQNTLNATLPVRDNFKIEGPFLSKKITRVGPDSEPHKFDLSVYKRTKKRKFLEKLEAKKDAHKFGRGLLDKELSAKTLRREIALGKEIDTWPPGEGPTGGPSGGMLFKPELAGEFGGAGGSLRGRIGRRGSNDQQILKLERSLKAGTLNETDAARLSSLYRRTGRELDGELLEHTFLSEGAFRQRYPRLKIGQRQGWIRNFDSWSRHKGTIAYVRHLQKNGKTSRSVRVEYLKSLLKKVDDDADLVTPGLLRSMKTHALANAVGRSGLRHRKAAEARRKNPVKEQQADFAINAIEQELLALHRKRAVTTFEFKQAIRRMRIRVRQYYEGLKESQKSDYPLNLIDDITEVLNWDLKSRNQPPIPRER